MIDLTQALTFTKAAGSVMNISGFGFFNTNGSSPTPPTPTPGTGTASLIVTKV